MYQILLSIHIISVITWVASLLILPRLFVYHRFEMTRKHKEHKDTKETVELTDFVPEKEEGSQMWYERESRTWSYLLWPSTLIAFATGGIMIVMNSGLLELLWLRLFAVVLLFVFAYQFFLGKLLGELKRGIFRPNIYYRVYNEIILIPVIALVVLAIVKPA